MGDMTGTEMRRCARVVYTEVSRCKGKKRATSSVTKVRELRHAHARPRPRSLATSVCSFSPAQKESD